MKKNIIKILTMGILVLFFINFYTIDSRADDESKTSTESSTSTSSESVGSGAISSFIDESKTKSDTDSVNTAKNVIGATIAIVQVVSITVAVVMLTILAVKYMVSSVSERAEIKKHAVVYVIGAIIIFAVNGIIRIIQKFSTNIKYEN